MHATFRVAQKKTQKHVTMPRLSVAERFQTISVLNAGLSERHVATVFNCHYPSSSLPSTIWRCCGQTATTQRQDEWIQQRHLENRFCTAIDNPRIIPCHRGVYPSIVIRRLHVVGVHAGHPAIRPILTHSAFSPSTGTVAQSSQPTIIRMVAECVIHGRVAI